MPYPHRRSAASSRPAGHGRAPRRATITARAGIILRQGMHFGPIRDVQAMFMDRGVALAPMSCRGPGDTQGVRDGEVSILPTADAADLKCGRLAGVVVPGGTGAAGELEGLHDLVKTARDQGLPVMAFGEGVAQAVEALGYEAPASPPAGVLIDDGVRILDGPEEVQDAIGVFLRPSASAAAAG